MKRTKKRTGGYDFALRCGIRREPPYGLPYHGTLRTAKSVAKRSGCVVDLFDRAGFRKGWVKPDGDYGLT